MVSQAQISKLVGGTVWHAYSALISINTWSSLLLHIPGISKEMQQEATLLVQ